MVHDGRSRLAGGLVCVAVAWSLWTPVAGAATYRPAAAVERRDLSDAVFVGRVAGRLDDAEGGIAVEVGRQFKGRLPTRVVLRSLDKARDKQSLSSSCGPVLVKDSRYLFYVRVRGDGRLTTVGPPESAENSLTSLETPKDTHRVKVDASFATVATWEETRLSPDPLRDAAQGPSVLARSVTDGLSGVSIPADAEPFPSRLVRGDSAQTIPYRVDAAVLPAGLSLEETLNTVARAFEVWEEATGLRFRLDAVEDFESAADQIHSDDGVIRIQLHDRHGRIDDPLTLAFGGLFAASGPLGFGYGGRVFDQEFHRTTGGYVIVNHRQELLSNPTTLEEVLAHEIGHTLGLAHSSDVPDEEDPGRAQALMFFRVHADGRGARLTEWDRQTVGGAYPREETPPAAYSAVHHAVTVAGGAEHRLPEMKRIPIHRGPREPTNGDAWTIRLFPAVTSATHGEFVVEGGDIAYHPLGFFEKPALDPSSASYYDRAVYRIETGTHASAVESVRVLSLGRDGLHEDPDGLPDTWVERWFGAGSSMDPASDTDGDGCSEKAEFQQDTDPGDSASCVAVSFATAAMTVLESEGAFGLELRCSQPTARPLVVEWNWKGSAHFGVDYLAPAGYAGGVVLPAGVTQWVIPVSLQDDGLSEGTELLEIEITSVEGAGRDAVQRMEVTILDDEQLPVYRFAESAYETREGSADPLLVTVLRSGRTEIASCVRLRARGGEAESPIAPEDDLESAEWDLCFAEGETAITLTIVAVDDETQESVESGWLALEVLEGGLVDSGGAEARLTIEDNDRAPRLELYAEETREDAPQVELQARLSHPSRFPVVVTYTLRDGSAKAAEDYVNREGSIVVPPGEAMGLSTIELIDDEWSEETEEFYVVVTSVENAEAGAEEWVIRLLDDEERPGLAVPTRINATEGERVPVSATLTGPAAVPVEFDWRLVARTAATRDDVPAEGGVLRFAPGEMVREVELAIPDDAIDEPVESVFLEITGRVHAQPGPFETEVVVADNDPRPILQIEDFSVGEADGVARFPVRLSAASGFEITVQLSTGGGTAIPGLDYQAASGTLVLPPGSVEVDFEIPLIDDFLTEPDETFDLTVGLARNVAIDRATAGVVILDDDFPDQPGVLTLQAASVVEGTAARIQLTRLPLSAMPTTVRYRTVAETARAPDDFAETAGEAVIPPGKTSVFVEIPVSPDGIDEEDETFKFEIIDSGDLILVEASLQLTILDNDDPPGLMVETLSTAEGDSTSIRLRLSGASGRRITGSIAVVGGTATEGEDFVLAKTTFMFSPGETEKDIDITIVEDLRAEETETIFFTVNDLVNALDSGAAFSIEISDNEILPVEGRLELENLNAIGEFRWQGREGLRYRIQASRDLREWQELFPTPMAATGYRESLPLEGNEIFRLEECYFRLLRSDAEDRENP